MMADSGMDGGRACDRILGNLQRAVPFTPSVSGALTFVSFWNFYVRRFLELLRWSVSGPYVRQFLTLRAPVSGSLAL